MSINYSRKKLTSIGIVWGMSALLLMVDYQKILLTWMIPLLDMNEYGRIQIRWHIY